MDNKTKPASADPWLQARRRSAARRRNAILIGASVFAFAFALIWNSQQPRRPKGKRPAMPDARGAVQKPKAKNAQAVPEKASFAGNVAEIRFNTYGGFHEEPISVEIHCDTADAVIRYTTDCSEPSESRGIAYSRPIEIGKTTVLRAIALKPGWAPSRVGTQTHVFREDIIASGAMRPSVTKNAVYGPRLKDALRVIPSISLVAAAAIRPDDRVKASFEWVGADGKGEAQEDCGVIKFGGAFTRFQKESFRLYFRSEYGASKLKFPLFKGHEHGFTPVEEFDQLELRSGSHDMAQRGFYMSNVFADDTMLEMGQLNPHGRFVHLYLNGAYWGVYHLRERWGAGMHHRYFGGDRSDYESINGNWNVGGWAQGKPYDGDGTLWKQALEVRGNYRDLGKRVDLPHYIDFMLLWIFGRCEDEYRCVGTGIPGAGFKFYINDADGFFQSPANPWYGEPEFRTGWTRRQGLLSQNRGNREFGDGPGGLFGALAAQGDSDYMTLLADRIYRAYANDGVLSPARTAARLKLRCEEMELPFLAEAARWGYRSPSNWKLVRDDVLNNWLPTRTLAVFTDLRTAGFYPTVDAPMLNQQGGKVAGGFQLRFTGPANGDIFYTLDGSDPRLPGGGVAAKAQTVSVNDRVANAADAKGALVIERNTVLKCRTREGKQWSALNEAFFQASPSVLAPGQIQITGLNFPAAQEAGSEFIELTNKSQEAVNLRGAHFAEGIEYAFAGNRDIVLGPGQKLLLVRDLVQFRQSRGPDAPVEGIYSRKAKKSVRKVTLSDFYGKEISSRSLNPVSP